MLAVRIRIMVMCIIYVVHLKFIHNIWWHAYKCVQHLWIIYNCIYLTQSRKRNTTLKKPQNQKKKNKISSKWREKNGLLFVVWPKRFHCLLSAVRTVFVVFISEIDTFLLDIWIWVKTHANKMILWYANISHWQFKPKSKKNYRIITTIICDFNAFWVDLLCMLLNCLLFFGHSHTFMSYIVSCSFIIFALGSSFCWHVQKPHSNFSICHSYSIFATFFKSWLTSILQTGSQRLLIT